MTAVAHPAPVRAAPAGPPDATLPLAPVVAAQRALLDAHPVGDLARGLLVADDAGWSPASALATGAGLRRWLDLAQARWHGSRHASAAKAWKGYAYRLGLPAVLGWACARRVPLLDPDDVLVRLWAGGGAPIAVGLRRSIRVAVLATDPIAHAGLPAVSVVSGEDALLGVLRRSLLDRHVEPLLDLLHHVVGLGPRPLLGSLASGLAYGGLETAEVLPVSLSRPGDLLAGLGLNDLVDVVPGPGGASTVRRHTCCLGYTLPESRMCPGCALRAGR